MHNCTAGFETAIVNSRIYENITWISIFACFMMINCGWSLPCSALISEFAVFASTCQHQALLHLFYLFFNNIFWCSHDDQQMSEVFLKTWALLLSAGLNVIVIKLAHFYMWYECSVTWYRHNTRTGFFLASAVRCVNNYSKWGGSHWVCVCVCGGNLVVNGCRTKWVQIHALVQLCTR